MRQTLPFPRAIVASGRRQAVVEALLACQDEP